MLRWWNRNFGYSSPSLNCTPSRRVRSSGSYKGQGKALSCAPKPVPRDPCPLSIYVSQWCKIILIWFQNVPNLKYKFYWCQRKISHWKFSPQIMFRARRQNLDLLLNVPLLEINMAVLTFNLTTTIQFTLHIHQSSADKLGAGNWKVKT